MKLKNLFAKMIAIIVALLLVFTSLSPVLMTAYADDETKAVSNDTYIEDNSDNEEESAAADGIWYNRMEDVEVQPANPENGTIVFVVKTMPEDALNRTVRATVAYGPADETLKTAKMSGLNSYVDSVEIEPGQYFCSYGLTNDYAMDYPVSARDDMYTIQVEADSCTVVQLDVSGKSYYEQITGKNRFYTKVDTIPAEDGFDTNAQGQIGCYLTVPSTFGDTCEVYVENLFTGVVTKMDLYSSNKYTAYDSTVKQGRYKVVGTRVLAEGVNRFAVECEQDTISTNETGGFHLTIYDSEHPDAEMVTPGRDSNSVVKRAEEINTKENAEPEATPEPTEAPTPEPEQEVEKSSRIDAGFVIAILVGLAILIPIVILGVLWWKNQHTY